MTITIRDTRLKAVYNQMAAAKQQIDDGNVVKILATIADGQQKSAASMLVELAKPGLTRQQQLEIVQAGLSKSEVKDLCAILDKGTVPMSPSARNFLEQVVGRAPSNPGGGTVTPPTNPLNIVLTGDQRNGIAGIAGPGVTIEAINITTAPGGRLHLDDTFVLGKTDASGRFIGQVTDLQEGDLIRMRARDAKGNVGEWMTVSAKGLAQSDTRNAIVALFRIGLTDQGTGKVAVSNINGSRPISEPGAKVQFTNLRTGEKTIAVIDDQGQFPKDLTLNGKGGDKFRVAATDGKNNSDFAIEAGPMIEVPEIGAGEAGGVDLPDPGLCKDEIDEKTGKPKFGKKRFTGPLFKDGVDHRDVVQGQIGDCYFPAAISSLAKFHPEIIQNMIKDNGDGTFTFTFHQRNGWYGEFKPVQVKVDADLYVRTFGGPLYGAASGDRTMKGMELWFPLLEKAFAQFRGSYDRIGQGGTETEVWEACMGKETDYLVLNSRTPDMIWEEIKSAVDSQRPIGAGTFGEDQEALYTNTGVYANHCYSILGYVEKNGERYVTLRNPWGESEPRSYDDFQNDGVFNLKLADFMKLYHSVQVVSA